MEMTNLKRQIADRLPEHDARWNEIVPTTAYGHPARAPFTLRECVESNVFDANTRFWVQMQAWLQSEEQLTAHEFVAARLSAEQLNELLLGTLTKVQAETIGLRYQTANGTVATYEEVGYALGITRQAVQVREKGALKRIAETYVLRGVVAAWLHRNFEPWLKGYLNARGCCSFGEMRKAARLHLWPIEFWVELCGGWGLFVGDKREADELVFGPESEERVLETLRALRAIAADADNLIPLDEAYPQVRPVVEVSREEIIRWLGYFRGIHSDGKWLWLGNTKAQPTLRDVLCYALTKLGRPAHFEEIDVVIKQLDARWEWSTHSAHNELLNHKALFARQDSGTYGLTRWGLSNVRYQWQIMASALELAQRPLSADELQTVVLRERPDSAPASVPMLLFSSPARFRRFGFNLWGLAAWPLERFLSAEEAASVALPSRRRHTHASEGRELRRDQAVLEILREAGPLATARILEWWDLLYPDWSLGESTLYQILRGSPAVALDGDGRWGYLATVAEGGSECDA